MTTTSETLNANLSIYGTDTQYEQTYISCIKLCLQLHCEVRECDYRRALDWRFDLMTTLTYDS
jgi:hypothetical protein